MLHNRRNINILLALLLLAGFLITSWLSYRVAHQSIETQIANDSLPLTSDTIYSEIQHDLFKPIFISSLMAQDTFVRDWKLNGENNPEQLTKYLKEIQIKYNTVTSYFISDATLTYYHADGILKEINKNNPADHWYFNAKNLPEPQEYEVNIDYNAANTSSLAVFVNYKVFDYDNNFIGITGVGLALDDVKQLIHNYQQRYQRKVYFIDTAGEITLYSELADKNIEQTQQAISPFIQDILNKRSHAFTYQKNNNTTYLNTRFVEEFNWFLMVEQQSSSSDKALYQTLKLNILLSILVTLGVLLLAHFTFNRYQKRLEVMATTDKLSGLLNRQAFEPIIENNLEQSKRQNTPLCIISIDIDYFKKINDSFGHLTGDKVIKRVATTCQLYSREYDALSRWGGEEFILMLPNTDIDDAVKIATRIQQHLAQDNIAPKVTASFGVTKYRHNEALDDLLNRADKALYQAKDQGRNTIKII